MQVSIAGTTYADLHSVDLEDAVVSLEYLDDEGDWVPILPRKSVSSSKDRFRWHELPVDDAPRIEPFSVAGTASANHPSVGLLLRNGGLGNVRTSCTGTLIHSRLVLTAAHCFMVPNKRDYISARQKAILLGDGGGRPEAAKWQWYLPEAGVISVKRILLHEDYRVGEAWGECKQDKIDVDPVDCELSDRVKIKRALINDLALVELAEDVRTVEPMSLRRDSTGGLVRSLTVGYGLADENDTQDTMIRRVGLLRIVDCEGRFDISPSPLPQGQYLCSEHESDGTPQRPLTSREQPVRVLLARDDIVQTDPCKGDSGGPMLQALSFPEGFGVYREGWRVSGVLSSGYVAGGDVPCSATEPGRRVSIYGGIDSTTLGWIDEVLAELPASAAVTEPSVSWSVLGEFFQQEAKSEDVGSAITNDNVRLFRLRVSGWPADFRVRVSLNGIKGPHLDALKGTRSGTTSAVLPVEFDLQVSRHELLNALKGFPMDHVTAARKGYERIARIDCSDMAVCERLKDEHELVDDMRLWSRQRVAHGEREVPGDATLDALIDCNDDRPGNLGSCWLDDFGVVVGAVVPHCRASICVEDHRIILVNRISGRGEYQLTVSTWHAGRQSH